EANEERLKSVLDNMIIGVIVIDHEARISLVNPMAEKIIGFSHHDLVGQPFHTAHQQKELFRLVQLSWKRQQLEQDEIVFYYPQERTVEATIVPLVPGQAGEVAGLLVWLQDISELKRLERI